MKQRPFIILGFIALSSGFIALHPSVRIDHFWKYEVGQAIDSLDGVKVLYNGQVSHTCGRNLTSDGYNLGLKYQCVEFAKRYYYLFYNHRMPNSYGHAKDFFNPSIADGKHNSARNLKQFHNGSLSCPQKGDLIVWNGNRWNPYGHIAVVSEVREHEIEITQQNPGPTSSSRITIGLYFLDGKWQLDDEEILGWLGNRF